jgi:hypothetical protein
MITIGAAWRGAAGWGPQIERSMRDLRRARLCSFTVFSGDGVTGGGAASARAVGAVPVRIMRS